MSRAGPQNRARPHDIAPDCPECESDVFVHAKGSNVLGRWKCAFCGDRFNE